MTQPTDDDRYIKQRSLARIAREGPLVGLLNDRNISGVGYGRREVNGVRTDEPAVVVFVARKVPMQFLPPTRALPRRVYIGRDHIEVDVVETGPFYFQAFLAGERPAPNGISVGHIDAGSGTLGSLVLDNADRALCILSNNHVLANLNAASLGDTVVQPGPFDGGTTPADDIATLKRFVTVNPTGNLVDCAIAEVNDQADVIDQVKNNLIPVASGEHPAVGLVFSGSCNRSCINPIDTVLSSLNVSFLRGGGVTATVDVGANVEKVGRETEYTTSTVTEIDVSASVGDGAGNNFGFDLQIATALLSEAGDSGSLVYLGGEGGTRSNCGCASASTVSQILDRDVELDQAVEKEFRRRYLLQTQAGRFAADTYFANEDRIVERARRTELSQSDRLYLQRLYDTYADTARALALQPQRSEVRLTRDHLEEARRALRRFRQYLYDDEADAAEELFGIAREAEGRTPSEILQLLDDDGLLRRVRELVARIGFLRPPERAEPPRRRPPKPGSVEEEPEEGSSGGTAEGEPPR